MTDTWHPLLQLLVVMLAVARFTVLLVDDAILDEPRGRLLARVSGNHYAETLIECQRCLGFWVALAGTIAWFHWPAGVTVLAVPWAVAMLAWWAGASWIPDPDIVKVETTGDVELDVSRQE